MVLEKKKRMVIRENKREKRKSCPRRGKMEGDKEARERGIAYNKSFDCQAMRESLNLSLDTNMRGVD